MRQTLIATLLATLGAAGAAYGQLVVSARAGMIHYVEGDVRINDRAVMVKFAQFPEVKAGEVLETGRGRAEMLLSPGVFVRVSEESSLRMVSTRLTDMRMDFLSGSLLIEVNELGKENSLVVRHGGATVNLVRHGLYRFDSQPARLRVFDGRAELVADDRRMTLKKGREASLDGQIAMAKFDTDKGDSLHRWSARRSSYIAMANLPSANSLQEGAWSVSGWRWNPYFGLMTFIPHSGISYSPFGYRFYSPGAVYAIYRPRPIFSDSGFGGGGFDSRTPRWDSNVGYSTVGSRSYGGPPAASSGPAAAAPAPSSPRSAESSAPRGSEGGGRGR